VAAAPDFGPSKIDELVIAVKSTLERPNLMRSNRLREELTGHDGALDALRRQRRGVLRADQQVKADRSSALRKGIQQARLELIGCARRRCELARTEFQQGVDVVTRRTLSSFRNRVCRRAEMVVDEIGATVRQHLTELEWDRDLRVESMERVAVAARDFPPLPRIRRLEGRLTMLLGLSFGIGLTLALARALTDLPTPWGRIGLMVSLLLGTSLGLWVARTRSMLQRQVNLDRWVNDVAAELRVAAQELVVSQLLAAERGLADAAAERGAAEFQWIDEQLAGIDRAIRSLTRQRDRTEKELGLLRAEFERIGAIPDGDPR
jgi:hypothetical protein